jgi:hypothetical protein
MAKLISDLFASVAYEATCFTVIDAALVILLRKPLSRIFFDNSRGLLAMKVKRFLEDEVLPDTGKPATWTDVVRQFPA